MASTYILETGSAVFGSITFDSVTSISVTEGGNATPLTTDGSRYVNAIFVDSKTAEVRLSVSDISLAKAAALRVGSKGNLVIKGKLRDSGTGMVSTEVTMTLSESVVINITGDIPAEGVGSAQITFNSYDSNSDGTLIAWS